MKSFISLEEAIGILNNRVNNLEKEKVLLLDGLNRIIAEDIYSKIDNPPFDKSAMDGYAIIAGDSERLKVVGKIYAGEVYKGDVAKGTAVKVMTGAAIPKGADAVIKQENVIIEGDYIILKNMVVKGENICEKGEDISKGALLIKEGKKLDYADIGILASSGIGEIWVYKKPELAFISTGDEVIDIKNKLEEGKIYNSNKYSILSRVKDRKSVV